ncbi:Maf family protein [Gayadomonas joobiniege]|uniref:Maf family protein n=1 Tax=Gayadomonas joobiniege TaxID=1234606 RepID=UPI00037C4C4C|nr:Maf family protein [Gayadomonas joobiniege]
MKTAIYLASRSPRRKALLQQLNVTFTTIDGEINERRMAGELPAEFVVRLANEKAQRGWHNSDQSRWVLGADTIVVCEQEIFGKPKGEQDFLHMMQSLSGRTHQVMTAVAICHGEQLHHELVISDVEFATLSTSQMQAYWQTGEPADKAGGYGIQGLAGAFVKSINGSYSAIVGLPLYQTSELLKKIG